MCDCRNPPLCGVLRHHDGTDAACLRDQAAPAVTPGLTVGLAPTYDATELTPDQQADLVAGVSFANRAQLYAAEQHDIGEVLLTLNDAIAHGELSAADLVRHGVLEDLHRNCLGRIWNWAGRIRDRESNLGAAPEHIRQRLAEAIADARWRIEGSIGTPPEIAMNLHVRTVTVHPFVDGNGRVTRVHADAVLLALAGDAFHGMQWSTTPTSPH